MSGAPFFQQSKPALSVKEITDLYVRKNFENLNNYFLGQNQLVDFKFFELNFTAATANYLLAHGLSYVPQDVIVTKVTGPGVVQFNHGLFDQANINLTVTGACRVRFFVGSYWNYISSVQSSTTDVQQFSSVLSTGSSGSSVSSTGAILAPVVTLPLTAAQVASGAFSFSSSLNYFVRPTDQLILVSGVSATTVTLPSAIGLLGKVITVKRTDQTLGNAVTLTTLLSQTIDGAAARKLMTQYEQFTIESDGSNWQILSHTYPQGWTSFPMAITGSVSDPTKASSPVFDLAVWRRVGDSMEIRYQYRQSSATGAAAGSGTYQFAVPSGVTMDVTKIAANGNGSVGQASLKDNLTGSGVGNTVYNSTTTLAVVALSDTTALNFCSAGIWGDFSRTTVDIAFYAVVPIVNWEA